MERTDIPTIGLDDALFFDFDGTLTEIAATPGDVRVDHRVPALLVLMAKRLNGAVAVVSGRPVSQLTTLLKPYGGAMAGVYGLERRAANGQWLVTEPLPELIEVRRAFDAFAAARPGVVVEDKGVSVALHYRNSPEHGPSARALAEEMATGRLMAIPGKMVVEVHPRGVDKGGAIGAFLEEAPFKGRRPIYVGDDRPDEAGFDFVNKRGGVSVLVGLSVAPTVAQHRLDHVGAVLSWLGESVADVTLASVPAEEI